MNRTDFQSIFTIIIHFIKKSSLSTSLVRNSSIHLQSCTDNKHIKIYDPSGIKSNKFVHIPRQNLSPRCTLHTRAEAVHRAQNRRYTHSASADVELGGHPRVTCRHTPSDHKCTHTHTPRNKYAQTHTRPPLAAAEEGKRKGMCIDSLVYAPGGPAPAAAALYVQYFLCARRIRFARLMQQYIYVRGMRFIIKWCARDIGCIGLRAAGRAAAVLYVCILVRGC